MGRYRDVTGVIKARPGQPANFCPISCHAVADGYHTCKLINDMQEIAACL